MPAVVLITHLPTDSHWPPVDLAKLLGAKLRVGPHGAAHCLDVRFNVLWLCCKAQVNVFLLLKN